MEKGMTDRLKPQKFGAAQAVVGLGCKAWEVDIGMQKIQVIKKRVKK